MGRPAELRHTVSFAGRFPTVATYAVRQLIPDRKEPFGSWTNPRRCDVQYTCLWGFPKNLQPSALKRSPVKNFIGNSVLQLYEHSFYTLSCLSCLPPSLPSKILLNSYGYLFNKKMIQVISMLNWQLFTKVLNNSRTKKLRFSNFLLLYDNHTVCCFPENLQKSFNHKNQQAMCMGLCDVAGTS